MKFKMIGQPDTYYTYNLDGGNGTAPSDTDWCFNNFNGNLFSPELFTIENINNYSFVFSSWYDALNDGGDGFDPINVVGEMAMVHVLSSDEYFYIKFYKWTSGEEVDNNTEAGMGYIRSPLYPAPLGI